MTSDEGVARDLLPLLTCPHCRDSDLIGAHGDGRDEELTCTRCERRYPIRDGLPILLPLDVGPPVSAVRADDKQRQVLYYEHETDLEFEIERPANMPRAYTWVLTEKLHRSVRGLPPLAGTKVINPCCGSGMEAEFLARSGARVLAVDLSEACARRARTRAQRHGVDYLVVVGDVERLPIKTGAAEIAYVHDGLHHLVDPLIGVRELTRVARQGVSINEPAQAVLTRVAVRLGIAAVVEEAGNVVARLRPEEVRRELNAAGFQVSESRYLVYYRHRPAKLMALSSLAGLFPLYRAALGAANLLFGRWGNKLSMTGVRKCPN